MLPASSTPAFPKLFVVLTFAAAAVVGAAVLYFGLHGELGAAIP